MRPERLYLQDILNTCNAIERFLRRTTETAFMPDELVRSAILQKLIVIGEAAARLPRNFIKWADIVAFRNIAVHEYFAVDWKIVWIAATEDVPFLRDRIKAILSGLEESNQP
jgi:uncharacterized protein with HEPN domain